MRWIALIVALLVTSAGAAFVGPMGDDRCRDDAHPGLEAPAHWAEDRTIPPVWACRYQTEAGDVWRHEQYGALFRAGGLAALLFLLIVVFRRRPPPALQGALVAWVTLAVYGAFASFDVTAPWMVTPFVVVPCLVFDLRRPIPGVIRWWWAAAIVVVAWLATVTTSIFWGDVGNPWPALLLGALLGAGAPRRAFADLHAAATATAVSEAAEEQDEDDDDEDDGEHDGGPFR